MADEADMTINLNINNQPTLTLSHRCDQSWLVPEAYDHTGVIRTFSASRHQLLNSNLLSCFGWRGARSDVLSICHIITTIQCFQPYNAYFRLQTFKHA